MSLFYKKADMHIYFNGKKKNVILDAEKLRYCGYVTLRGKPRGRMHPALN